MKEKRRRIPVNIRIAIRMALLIVGVSLSLIFAALAINAKKYRTAQLDIFKTRGRNAGRSVALLLDSNKVISFIDQVREIYENAPAKLRDTPADPDAMYKYAVEDGAYEALFAPVETPAYLKMRDDLEEMARETDAIDINIFFIDYERHRKVFVMYAIGDEKYRDLYSAPGYWVDIYDFTEEYAKGGDPDYKGFYTDYMIENGKVRTLESIVPYFDHAAGNISTFVAVEQRWKVMDDERVSYTRRFFLSMSAFTLILTLLSEGVLQFTVIRPLNRLTEKQARMSTELDLAANLQLSMLPVQTARQLGADGYDIHARLTPAREVGGDFYDYFIIDEDHTAIVIADVVGKGVPASIFAMAAKTVIKMSALDGHSPMEVCAQTNRQLCENNNEMMFSTTWFGIYTISERKMVYANAGHNDPLLMRAAEGRYEYLSDEPDMALGVMEGLPYTEHTVYLSPGDKMFLYTDGVVEAQKPENERLGHAKKKAEEILGAATDMKLDMVLYGDERLRASLNADVSRSGDAVLDTVLSDVRAFVGDEPQFDDITMLVFEIF